MTGTTRRAERGFTLIELLVVIAIIAILAAILFPVFARARENARRASCSSNLKQIALGVFQYTQDYDERFPMRFYSVGSYYAGAWANTVQPYLKSAQLFQCPSESTAPGDMITSDTNSIDYGWNWSLGATNESVSIASFEFPTVTVMTYDSPTGNAARGYYDNNLDAVANKRHLEGANYAFVDGHVKWYRPEKVLSALDSATYTYNTALCASTGASYAGLGQPTFCR
jgi:prepilin-type N-terminal cleavage/methylation domain-containing protein/prepilin-type processing-associated H-X9-DG protein